MNNNYIVYMHTSPSNKRYIGIASQNPERRWRKDGKGYKDHLYFWKAIQKYGWDSFKHDILYTNLTKEEAEKKEVELIAYYNSNDANFGYNISIGGESGSKGYKHTDKQKKHMSEVHKGEKNGMYGKHHTKETIEKERVVHLKENLSDDTIRKMSLAKKGKKRDRRAAEKQIQTISTKIICVETSTIYNSIKEAGILNNIDPSCISKVCRGKREIADGFHWCYGD